MQIKEELSKLGMEIKIARVRKNLTQADLAREIGCSKASISSWENGEKSPSFLAIKGICSILEINLMEGQQKCRV